MEIRKNVNGRFSINKNTGSISKTGKQEEETGNKTLLASAQTFANRIKEDGDSNCILRAASGWIGELVSSRMYFKPWILAQLLRSPVPSIAWFKTRAKKQSLALILLLIPLQIAESLHYSMLHVASIVNYRILIYFRFLGFDWNASLNHFFIFSPLILHWHWINHWKHTLTELLRRPLQCSRHCQNWRNQRTRCSQFSLTIQTPRRPPPKHLEHGGPISKNKFTRQEKILHVCSIDSIISEWAKGPRAQSHVCGC